MCLPCLCLCACVCLCVCVCVCVCVCHCPCFLFLCLCVCGLTLVFLTVGCRVSLHLFSLCVQLEEVRQQLLGTQSKLENVLDEKEQETKEVSQCEFIFQYCLSLLNA